MIHISEFCWRFADSDAPSLRDISIDVLPGEFVVLAGPSGSGKSTLAQAMCGLLIGRRDGSYTGTLKIDGEDVAKTPLHLIAQTIGLVQQNPETQFATMTVDDEIVFGLENHCLPSSDILSGRNLAMEQMEITHLQGRNLATLSGGEQQRVAIASIMAGRLKAMVLDEPTAALDPAAAKELFGTLADLCRDEGLTVVVVEHRLDHLHPISPRFIELRDGKLREVEQGHTHAIRSVKPGTENVSKQPDTDSSEPLVEASSLCVEYDDIEVLHDVSFHASSNEFIAIMGPNGGGKTTLLHCLCGLVKPKSGVVRLMGHSTANMATHELTRHVGMVFQNADHQIVTDSIWKEALYTTNMLGLTSANSESYAKQLLDMAGILGRRNDHPYRLSWGEKRRLNVISALLHGPTLLLLDEPFAGQDWECLPFFKWAIGLEPGNPTADLTSDNQSRTGTRACIMVTHDSRIVGHCCTRIIFVDNGLIMIDDPPSEAFERMLKMGYGAFVPNHGGTQLRSTDVQH